MKYFVALLLFTAVAMGAELEFTAYFTTSKESFYMLSDKQNRATSGWIKVGESFSGYLIQAFERESDDLILKKADKVVRVHLRESKVKDGMSTISGTIELGPNETVEGVRATLFLDEEMAFPVKPGVTLFLKAARRSDGNLSYHARFEVAQADGTRQTFKFPEIGARPGYPFRIKSGDYGFGFIP